MAGSFDKRLAREGCRDREAGHDHNGGNNEWIAYSAVTVQAG